MKRVKVSTREIVIVGIMVVAVLYGVYSFLIASSSKSIDSAGQENVAEIDTLIADASKILEDSDSYPVYASIVTGAEADWKKDPFYENNISSANVIDSGSIEYTGYLEIGARRIAVINGVSYEVGDELELVGYIVKHIRPSAVVIEEEKKGASVTVPLSEE